MEAYIRYDFNLQPRDPWADVLMAQLGAVGFESFVDTNTGIEAYVPEDGWDESMLSSVDLLSSEMVEIIYSAQRIEQVNWNAKWEQHFEPILVGEDCAVRAPFHESFNRPYEIVIEPKMSFGTGHHETTFMMMEHLMEMDLDGQSVLDMGCGTAVLAILAKMRGATHLEAIDIDNWCVENSLENCQRNNAANIRVILGGAEAIPADAKYDLIIANINRNILLDDMPTYVAHLNSGGCILFSGFYTADLDLIKAQASQLGMEYVNHRTKNDWVAAKFVH